MTAGAILSTDALSFGFHRSRPLAPPVSVTVRAGELVALLGPNGAGKSTLLRTLAGLRPPIAGVVRCAGKPLSAYSARELAQHRGVVLTEAVDSTGLLVRDLVALGRYPYTDWTGRLSDGDRQAVDAALEETGLRALADRRVDSLSDGERQKALIARALAQTPRLLILDEPTAFLDVGRRAEIMRMLRDWTRRGARAALLATHDWDWALRLADWLWLLPAGGPLLVDRPEVLATNGVMQAAFGLASTADSGEYLGGGAGI